MQAKKTASIKEVAVPTGLAPSTLRSYEEIGSDPSCVWAPPAGITSTPRTMSRY